MNRGGGGGRSGGGGGRGGRGGSRGGRPGGAKRAGGPPRGDRPSARYRREDDRGPRRDDRPAGGFKGPRPGGGGFKGPRPAGGGFKGPRPAGGGFKGPRPEGGGFKGPRPAGGGFKGPRPAGGGFKGPRPAGGGFKGPRPAGGGFKGPRPEGGGFKGPRSEGGGFKGPRRDDRPSGGRDFDRGPRRDDRPSGGRDFDRGPRRTDRPSGGRDFDRGPRRDGFAGGARGRDDRGGAGGFKPRPSRDGARGPARDFDRGPRREGFSGGPRGRDDRGPRDRGPRRDSAAGAFKRPKPERKPHAPGSNEGIRLQALMARAGVASRREAEQIILEGRVTKNGEVVRELGTRAIPGVDHVKVDGKLISAEERKVYILFNKPREVITAVSDPKGRPVVTDYVKVRERVFPVGRLDWDTEGLLLLTNDGDLAYRLTHPKFEMPRTYHAKVKGIPDEKTITRLRRGIRLDDGKAGVQKAAVIDVTESNAWLEIVVSEGRNRLVRRLLDAVGHPVTKLKRVAYAGLGLGDLKPGASRLLSQEEVARLKKKVADATPQPAPRGRFAPPPPTFRPGGETAEAQEE